MSFYTEVDDLKVIDRNIERLVSIEASKAKRMIAIFRTASQRMKEKLPFTGTGSFTEAQMTLMLAQTDAIIESMVNAQNKEINDSGSMIMEQSIDDLGKEIFKFSKEFEGISRVIPIDAIFVAMESENVLLNQYKASIQSYNRNIRDFIQRELTQSIISAEPSIKVVHRIMDTVQLQEWRVARIVRTELHSIYNMSKNDGMLQLRKDTIPDLKKTLIHPMDGRTSDDSKLAESLKLVVEIDKPFKYTWNGKERVFFSPPDRPNDRSILVPFRSDWDR